MAEHLLRATSHLAEALVALDRHPEQATTAATAAIKCQRELERSYRGAMSALLGVGDIAEAMGRRELYRRYARLGEAVVRAAERVSYALIKQA